MGNSGISGKTKPKKLYHNYKSLQNIKIGSKHIREDQDEALYKAYEAFKSVKDCIFNVRRYEKNPSIKQAVVKHSKRKRDAESDNFGGGPGGA